MADTVTKEKRSQIMRLVKSNRNRSTEIKLIKFFKTKTITGWRRNYKLFGKPDFVFPKLKYIIFVDGCFWHGHHCRNIPKGNKIYWQGKIIRNKKRDKEVTKQLIKEGWRVTRIWECELKKENLIARKLTRFHVRRSFWRKLVRIPAPHT